MRTVTEIEAEIESWEITKGNSERKITELKTELTAAQNIEPPEAEQQSASSIDVDATIKDFNARRNSAPNPFAGKR
jgi:subtilisin-like proprotein convertase family protein